MILKPSNLYPSSVALDPIDDIEFNWTVNGARQTDFQVRIYKRVDNTLLHDSTKITTTTNSYTLSGGSLSNKEDIYWTVEIWNNASSKVSDPELFKLATKPSVSFTNPDFSASPIIIPAQEQNFELNYSQLEGIILKSFRFKLYDIDSNLIQDTGELYAGQYNYIPNYKIINMSRGESYKIEGIVTSEYNQSNSTGLLDFSVDDYTIPIDTPAISAIADDNKGNVIVDWADLEQILGVVTGSYSFLPNGKFNKGLLLSASSNIQYSKEIPKDDFTISFYHQFRHDWYGKIMELQDDSGNNIEIGYTSNNKFYYKGTDGVTHYSGTIIPYSFTDFAGQTFQAYLNLQLGNFDNEFMQNWLFYTVTKNKIYIQSDNGLGLVIDWNINLNPTSNHSWLKLYGESRYDHLKVEKRQFTSIEIENQDVNFETDWGGSTLYLAEFEDNLEAGKLVVGEPIVGWRLRRLDVGKNITKVLEYEIPKAQLSYIDTFARNNTEYQYELYSLTTGNNESLGQASDIVKLSFWGFILTDGKTSFKFDSGFGGLDTSTITTNKDFEVYETNSKFPIVIYGTERRYKTGSITAIPYQINETENSCERILDRNTLEEVEDFILDKKEKFLKNTNGELYKVVTNNFTHDYDDSLDGKVFTVSFKYVQTGEEE